MRLEASEDEKKHGNCSFEFFVTFENTSFAIFTRRSAVRLRCRRSRGTPSAALPAPLAPRSHSRVVACSSSLVSSIRPDRAIRSVVDRLLCILFAVFPPFGFGSDASGRILTKSEVNNNACPSSPTPTSTPTSRQKPTPTQSPPSSPCPCPCPCPSSLPPSTVSWPFKLATLRPKLFSLSISPRSPPRYSRLTHNTMRARAPYRLGSSSLVLAVILLLSAIGRWVLSSVGTLARTPF